LAQAEIVDARAFERDRPVDGAGFNPNAL